MAGAFSRTASNSAFCRRSARVRLRTFCSSASWRLRADPTSPATPRVSSSMAIAAPCQAQVRWAARYSGVGWALSAQALLNTKNGNSI